MSTRFFIDFDGTVTKSDVTDSILERFAKPEWRLVEKDWSDGRIGSRECLEKQMRLVESSPSDFKKLVAEVEIDISFISFLKKAKKMSVPVTIVSDGFQEVIEAVLNKNFKTFPELIADIEIYSNRIVPGSHGLVVLFPEGPLCKHGCANCKERIIQRLTGADDFIVFVGDGLSDRYAAGTAHLTFAKNKLLSFCRENKIKHKPYVNFKDVTRWLSAKVRYAAV